MRNFIRIFVYGLMVLGMLTPPTWGHAVPDHSQPKAGETLSAPPERVRIWFDCALETASSVLRVLDGKGRQVDKGDGSLNDSDPTLIEVSLPSLSAGTYKVIWSVVSRDGHRAQGDYAFIVK